VVIKSLDVCPEETTMLTNNCSPVMNEDTILRTENNERKIDRDD